MSIARHQGSEDAFADPPVRDAEPFDRKGFQDRVEDGAARDNQIRAVIADTGLGCALVMRHARKRIGDGPHCRAFHPGSIDLVAIIMREAQMHGRQGRNRPRCAEQLEIVEAARRRQPGHGGGDVFRDARAHPVIAGNAAAEAVMPARLRFRQRNDAPGDAVPAKLADDTAVPDLDKADLGRSAADVEDEGVAEFRTNQRLTAKDGKVRLLRGRDDVEGDPGFGVDTFDEVGTVGGAAAGLRRDIARDPDVAARQLLRAYVQRFHGALYRPLGQASGFQQPLAQPADARKGVDDVEALRTGTCDEKTAIVCAEVERAIGAAGFCDMPPLGTPCPRFSRGFRPGVRRHMWPPD